MWDQPEVSFDGFRPFLLAIPKKFIWCSSADVVVGVSHQLFFASEWKCQTIWEKEGLYGVSEKEDLYLHRAFLSSDGE